MDDCEHDWLPEYCDQCGVYLGDECAFCGAWRDPGNPYDKQDAEWCVCYLDEEYSGRNLDHDITP